jgi:DNA (cytosine-5)-methyltransferase 1
VLAELKYAVDVRVIDCRDFGVPQRRNRLVLLASKLGPIILPSGTYGTGRQNSSFTTVRDWIGNLPPIRAGEEHPSVLHHRAASLSPLNLRRIRATPEGGGREHWPQGLLARCHRGGYGGHIDVYSRLSWDLWSSGLTTRCISYSNGRFGHPDQDRALSVREAALLQTFPAEFTFTGSLNSMARQIGNAVPVLLAEALGVTVGACAAEATERGTRRRRPSHLSNVVR